MSRRQVPEEFLRSLNPKALPAAPGHNWEDPAFRATHAKAQSLSNEFAGKTQVVRTHTNRDGAVLPEAIKTSSARQLVDSVRAAEEGRSAALSEKSFTTLEDKILRFYAYFVENVRESAVETIRFRKVTIIFFPHDDTWLIQEPILPNSGLVGGVMLKRMRVLANQRQREVLPDYEHLNINHVNVGQELVVNGIAFNVYACDYATRCFMEELGIRVGADGDVPDDNYMKKLKSIQATAQLQSFGVHSQDRLLDDVIRTQRFLQDSNKVLLFNGLFDDRDEAGGRIRLLDVQMYLEDDTVCVVERQATGEAVPSGFLSRRRIPKDGTMSKTVELTFAHRVNGMRETNLGSPEAYYSPKDMYIGLQLNVFGRTVLLYDCDLFTREYYLKEFGLDVGNAIDVSGVKSAGPKGRPTLPTPPYTGYGTHEDSLSSCRSLALKPPRGYVLDPHSRNDVLRFQLRLHNPERQEDQGRVFVLSYYVDDGEMMVQETALRNSGFIGGKFNRKQRLLKSFDGVTPVFYKLDDIFVGNVVIINNFKFEVIEADEHTKNYLTHPDTKGVHPDVAVKITKERTLELLTALRGFLTVRYVTHTEAFRAFDRDKDGNITLSELFAGLKANLITNKEEEAVALLHQITDGDVIHHTDFFKWLAAPVALRTEGPHVDTSKTVEQLKTVSMSGEKLSLRNRVLERLKNKLEARCLTAFEMFRLASTMPRAYKGRRADLQCLTNTAKDVAITPVQLRRCADETLGLSFTEEEMHALLEYFFPSLPPYDRMRSADITTDDRVELKEFQARFNEMCLVNQLTPPVNAEFGSA